MTFLFLFELFIKYNEKVFILGIILIKKHLNLKQIRLNIYFISSLI
jgi:hypothetical protein